MIVGNMENRYQSDDELLYLYRQGNEEALELLIKKYQKIMRAYARGFIGRVKTSCEINDIYQVAVIALYSAVNSYKENMNCRFGSYFKIVMERAVYNYIRHLYSDMNRANREAISMDQLVSDHEGIYIVDTIATQMKRGDPEWEVLVSTLMEDVYDVLAQCSKLEQRVYDLWSKGFSYREIAVLCGVREKKVDNVLHQLKKKLRNIVSFKG